MAGDHSPKNAIAVLPFANLSPDPDYEYFSDGLTEEILNALAKIEGLRVTSRTSAFFFKGKNLPITEIGKSLKVSIILEGSVRVAAGMMRITAQLIDVEEDFHFWSETFDRPVDKVFEVQDEVSILIADKIREQYGHFEINEQLVQPLQVPVSAYQRYLKSRYHLLKMSHPEIKVGLGILEELVNDFPNYPMAHLGIHMAYTLMGTIGYVPAAEAFPLGISALEKAIKLAPDLPECQLQMAWNAFLIQWDFDQAYKHLNKVLESGPIVDYYQTMASTLVAEGKFKAAMNYIQVAAQIDPFSEISHHLKGFILYCQEEYDAAIKEFEECTRIKPDSQVSLLYWGQALILMGKPKESLAFFESLSAENFQLLREGGITLAQIALGNREHVEKQLAYLRSFLQKDQMEQALNLLILAKTLLGDHEEAFGYMQQGLKVRLPMMLYLPYEPMIQELKKSPEYAAVEQAILGKRSSFSGEMRKYKKSLLDPDQMVHLKEKLSAYVETERPYLDPELNLRQLAENVGMPANQLSQLLNEGFDQNYSTFINSFRVNAFKEKLKDPSNHHLTLLGLAYDSGFNSKTVFNTYFKKITGQTPKAYWKSVVG